MTALARARHSDDLIDDLRRVGSLVRDVLDAPDGATAFAAVVSYILHVSDIASDQIEEYVQRLGPRGQEAYMTGAQQLRNEGKAEGRIETLIGLVRARFGPPRDDQLDQLRRIDPEDIEQWIQRTLRAASIDDLLSET